MTECDEKRALIRAAAERFGVDYDEVLGERRTHRLAEARWYAMVLIKARWPTWSFPKIGRVFNLDHTTAIYGMARTFGWKRPVGSGNGYMGAAEAIHEGLFERGNDLRAEGDEAIRIYLQKLEPEVVDAPQTMVA